MTGTSEATVQYSRLSGRDLGQQKRCCVGDGGMVEAYPKTEILLRLRRREDVSVGQWRLCDGGVVASKASVRSLWYGKGTKVSLEPSVW